MLANFPSPVLNVATDVLKDLDGSEALTGLWFLFTKCQSSLNQGKRLENISWRLWSQQIAGRSPKYRPLTPDSPSESAPAYGFGTASSSLPRETQALSSRRPSIGKIIQETLQDVQPISQPFHGKLRLPLSSSKAELETPSSLLPTPAAELLSISIIPPAQSDVTTILSVAAPPSQSSNVSSRSVSPTIGSHAFSSPTQSNSFSNLGSTSASPFPVVVVVNPTPNPTPHPTPPATPILPATLNTDTIGSTHIQLPMLSPTSSRDRRQPSLFLAPAFDPASISQSRSAAHPSGTESHSPTLLPPSPHTSSSLMSVSSSISHLTASSSTSVHSNDVRSSNATLKPSDARIFFLKHGEENSSGSSDERSRSPVRPVMTTYTSDVSQLRNLSATTSECSTENLNRNSNGIHPGQSSRMSRQPSDGQGSTSPKSWGESDASDDHRTTVKSSKSSRRGSATSGRVSGSSDSKSRSRSRGRATYDGLVMSGRKKVHASLVTARKGARFGGMVHANGQGASQSHDFEQGTRQRVQGHPQMGQDSPHLAQISDRSHKRSPTANGVQQMPYPRQGSAQVLPTMAALGKRPMFNIGSQSPGDSPSNTDLSTSSQAHNNPVSPLTGETKVVSPLPPLPPPPPPPAGPLTRVRTQGHLLSRPPIHPPQPPPPPVTTSPRQPRGLPHASTNLSAAEAMIQAPRTRKVVLADDDDDDWDETETDLDSDFEDLDRKSDIDAEKGGTLVETGLAGGSGDNDEENDWVSENESGSGDAISAAHSKKSIASPPAAANQSIHRPAPSRHQSQPNIHTAASQAKQKHQTILEEEPRRPPPVLNHRLPVAGPSRTSRRPDRDREQQQQQALDQKLRDAALEAQRQREMFVKMPKRSYSNLSTRSQSGLLSQLMNPDPQIFPDSHPYKRGYSSGDVAAGGRPLAGLTRLGIQTMTSITSNGEVKGNLSAGAPPIAARRPLSSGVNTGMTPSGESKGNVSTVVPASSTSKVSFATMGKGIRPTKSAAALPISNSVTASSYIGDMNGIGDRIKGKEKQKESLTNNNSGGMYRPKGPPQEMEMEDESEDDPEQAIQLSKSAAHEKLAAFAGRRTGKAGTSGKGSPRAPPPPLYASPVPAPQPIRSQSQYVGNAHETILTPPAPVPLPLGFPYNLPPAAPPSSPRTTRQLMLRAEIPEELRQNLLWSRKILKQEFTGPRRKSSSALSSALRPLTAIPTVVHLTEKKRRPDTGPGDSTANAETEDDDDDLLEAAQILRPAKMQRNRSWAGGGR